MILSVFLKTIRLVFLGVIPLLLISNSKPIDQWNGALLNENTFLVTGDFDSEYQMTAHFENVTQTSKRGTSFSVIKLKLGNGVKNPLCTIEFLISTQNNNTESMIGVNRVVENITDFSNGFEGVFGYANINSLGQQPLFSRNGKIVITNMDTDFLKGYLNVTLKSSNGKKIEMRGGFTAKKKKIETKYY